MKRLLLFLIFSSVALGESVEQQIFLNSFNAGELSPLMNARVDLPKYRLGAKTVENMLVRAQGPITRRPGTKYIASVKNASHNTRIIPYEASTEFAYVIELGDEYARFYRNGAQVQSVGSAYEIVTPWDHTDVFELQFAQDANSMRIVHPDYEPYKLARAGHASWTCTAIGSTTGPFLDENTDTTWTLTPSATTGTGIDVVSTDNLFDSDHVGGLFQITHLLAADSVSKQFWSNGDANSASVTIQKYRYYDVMTSGAWKGTFKIQRSYDAGTTWLDVYSVTYSWNGNIQFAPVRDGS
jgi:hypothetical protein